AWRVARQEEELERRALRGQVKSIGGELSRARIVHDAMFPKQFDLGHIVFEYQYQPIAEIGGDYVHMHVCPETGLVYLTLLDVAGHGLAAALTVNRLFGELERIRAENPHARPHDVMALLNRYINLTMSRHSLFATGACIMIDPSSGELHWVNAGHPPALVRTTDGTIRELETTCMLLGVLPSQEFEPDEQCMVIKPGDVVIAYTDGVIEARSPDGEQFGLNRLRDTARFDPPPRFWSRFITSAVANHHVGHPDDDLLVVALTLRSRTMNVPSKRTTSTSARPDVASASHRQ
ncbi:MAG: serine/threonine-protein phosphatase, partial [Phycisphaerales bacterium]|nr:serine/threonine-protein phosphatase [Phycisphaerales bacterium]